MNTFKQFFESESEHLDPFLEVTNLAKEIKYLFDSAGIEMEWTDLNTIPQMSKRVISDYNIKYNYTGAVTHLNIDTLAKMPGISSNPKDRKLGVELWMNNYDSGAQIKITHPIISMIYYTTTKEMAIRSIQSHLRDIGNKNKDAVELLVMNLFKFDYKQYNITESVLSNSNKTYIRDLIIPSIKQYLATKDINGEGYSFAPQNYIVNALLDSLQFFSVPKSFIIQSKLKFGLPVEIKDIDDQSMIDLM